MAAELFKLTDNELVERVKEGCEESLLELSSRHSGLCHKVFRKNIHYTGSCSMATSEFEGDRARLVYEAALTFDDEKGAKFSTYLGNKVRFYCLNLLSKESKYLTVDDGVMTFLIDAHENFYAGDGEETIPLNMMAHRGEYPRYASGESQQELPISKENTAQILACLTEEADKRLYRVIKLRYFSDDKKNLVWSNIAKKFNMSIQGVINIHDRALAIVRKKIKNGDLACA